ncbi:unnamed protein product [Urochloa humidicola]
MLLVASAAASRALSLAARSGGREAPPGIRPAKPEALAELQLRSRFSTLSCACSPSHSPHDGGKGNARHLFDDFSVLSPVVPWEVDDIWRIYAGYFFILHIPLSFGGLGVVAKVLNCSSLDPMTTVSTRNWGKETVIGLMVLMALVSITSVLGEKLAGTEDAYDPILKGILSESPSSKLLCFFLYCVIAPLSEETIYRGFLLNGLSSSMKWHEAAVTSSIAFTVAHLSGDSSIQLFVIGCITSLAYCRTGSLAASFTIHSLYNAVILYVVIVS